MKKFGKDFYWAFFPICNTEVKAIKKRINLNYSKKKLLKVISRINAWILFLNILVLLVSGWGITQTGIIYRISFGLIDRRLADQIHRDAVSPFVFLLFAHILVNLNTGSSRRHLRNSLINILLGIIAIILTATTVYLGYYRPGG